MTCSLQSYRVQIGTFVNNCGPPRKIQKRPVPFAKQKKKSFWYSLLAVFFTLLFLLAIVKPDYSNKTVAPFYVKIYKDDISCMYNSIFDFGIFTNRCVIGVSQISMPPSQLASNVCLWITTSKKNKLAHMVNGNRSSRGKGFTCVYWNKGSAFLTNKMLDITTLVQEHKPHFLGLGEANFLSDHDINEVQIPNYTLHLDSSVYNPDLKTARVAVYTHD